jgi:phosphoglycolate phosphatase
MYRNQDHLVIMDADGTLIDAFAAIDKAFSHHGMNIGDLERFQKRRNFFKYIGGLKEFPRNVAKQLGKVSRKNRNRLDPPKKSSTNCQIGDTLKPPEHTHIT